MPTKFSADQSQFDQALIFLGSKFRNAIRKSFTSLFWCAVPTGSFVVSLLFFGASSVNGQQYWRTDGTSGTWVTGTNWSATPTATGGSTWASGSAVFNANSTVTFATGTVGNVTVANGVTVTVTQGGTLSTNSSTARTYNIGTGSTLTWSGQNVSTSANQAGFIKSGEGTWNIGAQANAYNTSNSGFTLNAGTVIVSGNNSFGGLSSVLTINGGTIQSSGTRAYANSSIVLGGNFENTGTGTATFSGTVALGSATRTFTNNITSGSRIYSGVISGTSGSGLTFEGAGGGETAITNSANTFTGDININGGEVRFTVDGSMGNAANDIIIDGGRFGKASDSTTVTLGAGRTISIGDGVGTSISSAGTGTLVYNGVIANKTGETGSWAKQGSGTLQLGGASTYTGATAINNGTLQLTTGNDRLPTGTTVSLGQAASANLGTLDLNGRNQQIAGLNSITGNNATLSNNTVTSTNAVTLTLGGSGNYSYGDGTAANSGVITGAISVVKSGAGTQTFGDTNTYTGSTTVNEGKLVVASTGSISHSASNFIVNVAEAQIDGSLTAAAITLNNGAKLTGNGSITTASGLTVGGGGTISGNRTITGNVTVDDNGKLSPGNSPGTITITGTGAGNLVFNGDYDWEVDPTLSPKADLTVVDGNLNWGATAVLNIISSNGGVGIGQTYSLFAYKGTFTGTFGPINGYTIDTAATSGGLNATGLGGGYKFLNITGVPEPTSGLLIGIGTLACFALRRNRRSA